MTMTDTQKKLARIRGQARAVFVDRAEVIDGLLKGMLACEHVMLVGPPGTAKSALARVLCNAILNAKFYTAMVGKTTTPEQFFGPWSLRGLKQDRYVRKYRGYLPTAHVAHLDEVFRASAASLDTLLKVIEERRFDTGEGEIDVPLRLVVGTTNTVPQSEELAAFWDRFALRYYVGRLRSRDDLLSLLGIQGEPSITETITLAELDQAVQETAQVAIPAHVLERMADVVITLRDSGYDVSERTMRKALKIMRAHAYLNGRSEVGVADLVVLADVAWDEPEQQPRILLAVLNASCPSLAKAREAADAAEEMVRGIPSYDGQNAPDVAAAGGLARQELQKLHADVQGAIVQAGDDGERESLEYEAGRITSALHEAGRLMAAFLPGV
jgi:MoxR-like ATPase